MQLHSLRNSRVLEFEHIRVQCTACSATLSLYVWKLRLGGALAHLKACAVCESSCVRSAGASAPLVVEHAYCNCLCDAVYMFFGSALDSLAVTIPIQISEERFA